MIKLQDFSREQGVTDRQIQRLLKKYAADLEGLFDRRGQNGTWLSDEACEILRGKMKQAPIVVSDASEELNNLRLENKRLLQALNAAKDRVIDLQDQNKDLALKTAQIASLEADNEAARAKAAQAEENAQKAQQELVDAHAAFEAALADKDREIEQLRSRKWYELIFKKKEK